MVIFKSLFADLKKSWKIIVVAEAKEKLYLC